MSPHGLSVFLLASNVTDLASVLGLGTPTTSLTALAHSSRTAVGP